MFIAFSVLLVKRVNLNLLFFVLVLIVVGYGKLSQYDKLYLSFSSCPINNDKSK